jgi:hypothetical protein
VSSFETPYFTESLQFSAIAHARAFSELVRKHLPLQFSRNM